MSASKQQTPKHGSGHQHPAELRERAVRMVQETMKATGERHGVVTRIAVQLGLGSETLRHWVKQAEIDGGSHLRQHLAGCRLHGLRHGGVQSLHRWLEGLDD